MEIDSTVLSFSFSAEKLKQREDAIRASGFDVVSVASAGQARFEIEMGRCGFFLTCRLVPDIVNQDLMNLFRRYCPKDGMIILVGGTEASRIQAYEPPADVRIPESLDPAGIVEALRKRTQASKAG